MKTSRQWYRRIKAYGDTWDARISRKARTKCQKILRKMVRAEQRFHLNNFKQSPTRPPIAALNATTARKETGGGLES